MKIGFSRLKDGMIISFTGEDGRKDCLVQETKVPSPHSVGSDFYHEVTAFKLVTFTGQYEYTPSGEWFTYVPGFPQASTIQDLECDVLGYYKVVYLKDDSKKVEEEAQKNVLDVLGMTKEELKKLLKGLE